MFHKEIDALREKIPADVQLDEVWLEQGLHREPARLQTLVRQEIAAAEEAGEPLDAILLGYGICSRGTLGISSRKYHLVVPRAHDCITLFLGSKERYLEEFSNAPGTYWFTPGFIQAGFQSFTEFIFRSHGEQHLVNAPKHNTTAAGGGKSL